MWQVPSALTDRPSPPPRPPSTPSDSFNTLIAVPLHVDPILKLKRRNALGLVPGQGLLSDPHSTASVDPRKFTQPVCGEVKIER